MKVNIVKYEVLDSPIDFNKTLRIEIQNKEIWKLLWYLLKKSLFSIKEPLDIKLKPNYIDNLK